MNMCVVFHRHVPFVRDVKQSFVRKMICRRENNGAISPSDEQLSHVMTHVGALRIPCHRMNMGVAFHRHVPFVRDGKQSFVRKMTCRRENIDAASPSDERLSRGIT